MKRTELEKHLGKKVKITLFDGEELTGILKKTEEYHEILKSKYYFLEGDYKNIVKHLTFRSSHVKKMKEEK